MPLDVEKYLPHFDIFDISRDEKVAMIEALWIIAEAVADVAWGIHPTQALPYDPDAYHGSILAAMKDAPKEL